LRFFIGLILPALWPWARLSLLHKSVPGVSPRGWRRPVH